MEKRDVSPDIVLYATGNHLKNPKKPNKNFLKALCKAELEVPTHGLGDRMNLEERILFVTKARTVRKHRPDKIREIADKYIDADDLFNSVMEVQIPGKPHPYVWFRQNSPIYKLLDKEEVSPREEKRLKEWKLLNPYPRKTRFERLTKANPGAIEEIVENLKKPLVKLYHEKTYNNKRGDEKFFAQSAYFLPFEFTTWKKDSEGYAKKVAEMMSGARTIKKYRGTRPELGGTERELYSLVNEKGQINLFEQNI